MTVSLLVVAACAGGSTDRIPANGSPDSDATDSDVAAVDTDQATVDCDHPGTVTLQTPPTVATDLSDYNVTLLDCTRTAVELACELGTKHKLHVTIDGDVRHITANGIPNHDVGAFPNPGNPNMISAQSYSYTVPVHPSGAGAASEVFGITTSGVVLDPGTAEVWNDVDAWHYEALRYTTASTYFGSDDNHHPTALGLDCNFAHVQPNGAYHYHGVPTGLMPKTPALTFVGWAADGYPIYGRWDLTDPADPTSALAEMRSSYRLRTGTRPSGDAGPGGTYDGTFTGDWEYVEGLGDLDDCNGRTGIVPVDGVAVSTYHYVLTNTFPYVPRCFHATPDTSFARTGPGGGGGGTGTLPSCTPQQTTKCCGDGVCDGPETTTNCAADCH